MDRNNGDYMDERIRDAEKEDGMGSVPQHINGISCDVKSCAYHDGDSFCTAGKVSIGPSFAKKSGQTSCATYRQRYF